MKTLKMLVVAAMAFTAMLMVASAGTASATVLTSPAGTTLPAGTSIAHELQLGTWKLVAAFGTVQCKKATGEYKTSNAGSSTETSHWSGMTIHVNECGCTAHITGFGSLEIHATGGGNATVTASGWSVETSCPIFGTTYNCIYSAGSGTNWGTLTGGSPAVLTVEATVSRTGGTSGAACGSTGKVTSSSRITKPNPLFVS